MIVFVLFEEKKKTTTESSYSINLYISTLILINGKSFAM